MVYHLSFDLAFTQNTFPGRYFALEGIDGSGKTTQAEKLGAYFKNQGKDVLITKEPSNSTIGLLIKEILHKKMKIPPISLQYLFAADRGVHLEAEVIPALKKGIIVISDRSFWSAAAYGIADFSSIIPVIPSEHERVEGSRQDNKDIRDINKYRLLVAYNILSFYHGFLVPDKTYVISVPAEVAIQRIDSRHTEQTLYEHQGKLNKVQKEYTWLAGEFSEYLTLVDGTKSVEEVHAQIVNK